VDELTSLPEADQNAVLATLINLMTGFTWTFSGDRDL
jgi:hypothetical protein